MTVSISLLKAEIDAARPVGNKGSFEHDGRVILRAKSSSLDFTYTCPFANKPSVAEAITQAAQMLAHELTALAAAAPKVLHPQRPPDEGYCEGDQEDDL